MKLYSNLNEQIVTGKVVNAAYNAPSVNPQILACAFPILPFLLAFNTGYPLPLLIITALTSAFAHGGCR